MKNKLVSVVIPAYNEEKYVTGCIKTLFNQSYSPIEIIFIDDGSNDSTLKIIQDFSKKHKNIKILKQNHQGPGIARNLGARKSRGNILVFVDADMEFDKNYIKNLVTPILRGKAIGTIHLKEYVLNKKNIWARFRGPHILVDKEGKGRIFRAIKKQSFFKYGPFDPKLGYADDQSISRKSGLYPQGTNAICYHKNPASLKETYGQSVWVGSSYDLKILDIPVLNLIFILLLIPFIPLYIFYLTLIKIYKHKSLEYFLYPIYSSVKYAGSVNGLFKRVLFKKKLK
jgi:glycosyltransferase involved in cell wall biosynthesis